MTLSVPTAAAIAARYTGAQREFAMRAVMRHRGLAALTPEALSEYILILGADRRFTNKLRARNRAASAARGAQRPEAAE